MNRLIKSIQGGKFAWRRYLSGGNWYGIQIHTCPLFCSYGQIGYSVAVFSNGQQTLEISHDWELNKTSYNYV